MDRIAPVQLGTANATRAMGTLSIRTVKLSLHACGEGKDAADESGMRKTAPDVIIIVDTRHEFECRAAHAPRHDAA